MRHGTVSAYVYVTDRHRWRGSRMSIFHGAIAGWRCTSMRKPVKMAFGRQLANLLRMLFIALISKSIPAMSLSQPLLRIIKCNFTSVIFIFHLLYFGVQIHFSFSVYFHLIFIALFFLILTLKFLGNKI